MVGGPTKYAEPRYYSSGYTLHLYCDHSNPRHGYFEFPYEYTGETFAQCARQARAKGWVIHRATRTATCPKCNPKRRRV